MDASIRDSPNTPNAPNTPNSGQEALKELLRSRQRAQNGVRGSPKSCLPCRERKVKCDKGHPCSTCAKRGHPDLCEYEHTSRASLGSTRSPMLGSRSGRRSSRPGRRSASPSMHVDVSPDPKTTLTHTPTANGGSAVLLSDNPVVNIARQPSPQSPIRQSAFETGILPLLGMGEERLAPQNSLDTLPSDEEIVMLFETYRHRVHPFHVITWNLDHIEEQLCLLINDMDGSYESDASNLGFLCLLHAILASGAQFSDMPLQQRILVSQKHTKHAFDLLRTTDYLAKPSSQAVQTLLLLGNVLQNDMQPQAAWVLGGTTIRLAQCLGLHERRAINPLIPEPVLPEEAKYLRLALVWQDALLALAFGRPPASHEMDLQSDLLPLSDAPRNVHNGEAGLSYTQAMNWLCHHTLRYLRLPADERGPDQLLSTVHYITVIGIHTPSYMDDSTKCNSIRKLQEYYAFELHQNFVISTLCRPFISSSGSRQLSEEERSAILDRLRGSLRLSVCAYVRLRSITGHARRSWAFIHNGLTSVLLLSLRRETRYLPETRALQDGMIASLSESDSGADSASESDTTSHLSDTLKKALKALQTLQRLTDRDLSERHADSTLTGTGDAGSDARFSGIGATRGQDLDAYMDATNYWDTGAVDWSFPLNVDMSPLGAFDYIMSEQNAAANDFFPSNIA